MKKRNRAFLHLFSLFLLCQNFPVARSDRAALLERQAATQAAVAAELAAVEAMTAAAAAEVEAAREAAERAAMAAEKRARESAAHEAVIAASNQAAARLRPKSNERNSFEYHKTRQYLLRSEAAPEFCLSVPRADRRAAGGKPSWRNGMAVLLAKCDLSDATQRFSQDAVSGMVHPEDSRIFCLDFDFDNKNLRPLTVFRCSKTFSRAAKPRHQSWDFQNNSNIVNRGTGNCLAVGSKAIYEGLAVRVGHEPPNCATSFLRHHVLTLDILRDMSLHPTIFLNCPCMKFKVQQYECSNIPQQRWAWIASRWYRALNAPHATHDF